jgi:hypothetical protein
LAGGGLFAAGCGEDLSSAVAVVEGAALSLKTLLTLLETCSILWIYGGSCVESIRQRIKARKDPTGNYKGAQRGSDPATAV